MPIHDQRGALVTLINTRRQIAETIRYTAYGEELTHSTLSPWRFCSKRLDPETNYLYFGRRFYSPTLGRWISPDPRGFDDGPNLYAYAHNSPFFEIDLYGEWGEYFQRARYWTGRALRATVDFVAPCAGALYDLPSDAPLWKRGALAFGAVGEVALCLIPPAKLGISLAERTVIQVAKGAARRQASRRLIIGAEKTAAVAAEKKIAQGASQSITQAERQFLLKETATEGSTWRFPKNPNDLLKELPRDPKGRIYTSDNLRIRPEQHSLKPGETFNPRHHSQHYHVEVRIDSAMGWNKKGNTYKLTPPSYEVGQGTGFLPGELFPGL